MKHKALLSSIVIGILVISSVFLLCAKAGADSTSPQLRTWMHENKVVSRLVKLDREDGFMYGLSLRAESMPGIVIAPGRHRTWLLQIEGEEAILQADARGSMQVIAQTDDFALYLCYLKKITEFLLAAPACTTPLCFVDKVLNLLIAFQVCTAAAAAAG